MLVRRPPSLRVNSPSGPRSFAALLVLAPLACGGAGAGTGLSAGVTAGGTSDLTSTGPAGSSGPTPTTGNGSASDTTAGSSSTPTDATGLTDSGPSTSTDATGTGGDECTETCPGGEQCIAGKCYDACEALQFDPSSIGCSFLATKHDNYNDQWGEMAPPVDALIVGNISTSEPVTAQLYFVPPGSNVEQPEGDPVEILPAGTATFMLTVPEIDSETTLRTGGVYRLATSRPVVAYQHSPIGAAQTNDASMLLPEHALTGNVIVASYPSNQPQNLAEAWPSYFTAIGVDDGTSVEFVVPQATKGGVGVDALAPGETGSVMMDRYSLLNIVAQQDFTGDLSGTIISASGPLHVIGAVECTYVAKPYACCCDHVEEALFPLEYWGQEYVGAHAPTRGTEPYTWRVYGGKDGVMVDTEPPQPGFPVTVDKGTYYEFEAQESFVFTGDGPFLPVQYLASSGDGAGSGDPSMVQAVPTEQYLAAYAFVTGTGYTNNYAQIIRPSGAADVLIDGNLVGGYYPIGEYEVADVPVSEGSHFASSDEPFGIMQVGYTAFTSYAYPGGLKLAQINPQ